MRSFRIVLLGFWFGSFLVLAVGATAAETEPSLPPLYFSGEPVGDEMALSYHLDADARRWLERERGRGGLDRAAASLERGDRIRAFAEAIAAEESNDPKQRALSHVRRAWILAEIGAVNFGAEHANLGGEGAKGELHLARAWLRWRAGDFAGADEEAALASTAQPAAPAWALATWTRHRSAHSRGAQAFAAMSEPDDSTSPAFLDYGEAARAAGAWHVADEAYFRALNMLQQERSAEPSTPPARLFRAMVARRDFLLEALGPPSPSSVGPDLWGIAVSAARSAIQVKPDRAAWDVYFSLLDVAQTKVPGFDFTNYDLAGDLAAAEKATEIAPRWRERFRELLARPDLRYAARELQALAKLEAHPAFEFQARPLTTDWSHDEIDSLDAFIRLMKAELDDLSRLRTELPAETPPGSRDLMFQRLLATQSFRLAVARERFEIAREQVEILQKLRTAEGQPVVEAELYAAALPELERRPFYALVARLAALPPTEFDPFELEDLQTSADEFYGELVLEVGTDFATRASLSPEQVTLAQYVAHARLIEAVAEGGTLVICDRLAELVRWCERSGGPNYPHLDQAKTTVAALPADPMNGTPPERDLLKRIAAGQSVDADTLAQAEAFRVASPNQLLPALLVAFTQWRLGDEDAAMVVMAQLRQRCDPHPATLDQLAQVERNNSTTSIMRAHLAKLDGATLATHPNEFAQARADANLMAGRIRKRHGGTNFDPNKLPPIAREAYAHAATIISLTRLAEGRLAYPAWTLKLLREQKEQTLLDRLSPAFASAPFQNDLRTPEATQVWSDLLQAAGLEGADAEALAQRATPLEADSSSIQLAVVALGLRRFSWSASEQFVNDRRQVFGANRAYARQLDLVSACIADCRAMPPTKDPTEIRRAYLARLARLFAELNRAAGL